MKVKTVWKIISTERYNKNIVGTIGEKIFLGFHADARWLNFYEVVIGDARLNKRGKIIGDADA